MSAPMGTGKTTWLAHIWRYDPFSGTASVCVVTHRTLLALLISAKGGLLHYLEDGPLPAEARERLGRWTLLDRARLAVVLNSVWRVGEAKYKVFDSG